MLLFLLFFIVFTSGSYEAWRKKWIIDKQKRKLSHYLDDKDETPSQEEEEDGEDGEEGQGGEEEGEEEGKRREKRRGNSSKMGEREVIKVNITVTFLVVKQVLWDSA